MGGGEGAAEALDSELTPGPSGFGGAHCALTVSGLGGSGGAGGGYQPKGYFRLEPAR